MTLGLVFGLSVVPSQSAIAAEVAYVSVVDAGSSGSRIALYESGAQPLGSPDRLMEKKPSVPPLSDFEANPIEAGPKGMGPLLDELDAYLASKGVDKSNVSVSVLATAGMRNVEQRDPAAAQAIMDSVTAYIPTRGYTVGEVSIMSGQREALYAWIDANASSGTLDDGDNKVGIVEIGGASAQVAFQSPTTGGRGVLTAKVGPLTFNVVALSYLGLGQNDARMFMRELGRKGAECFPNNATKKAPLSYESTTTMPLKASKANFVTNKCRLAYGAVMKKVGESALNLANNDRIRPNVIRNLPGFSSAQFQGVSSIAFNMATFSLKPGRNLSARFQKAITATCTGDNAWSKVIVLYEDPKDPFAQGQCANSQYTHDFTYGNKGVGVPQKQLTVDITSTKDQPSWSKGFALTQLNP
jgi:hypothetical protein